MAEKNMKVILMQDVENLGKKYEVKDVKPGYARNHLIPQKLVKLANKDTLKWLDSQKEVIEKEAEENLKKAQELASKLDGTELTIKVKVGDEGQLFESINSQKIAEKLNEAGFDVKKSQINLKDPIKNLGEFKVEIDLDHNLEAEVTLTIASDVQVNKDEE